MFSKKFDGRSQDLGSSMDEKVPREATEAEKAERKIEMEKIKEEEMKLQVSADEMRKKQAKKDEDPRITRFKNVEVKISLKFNGFKIFKNLTDGEGNV